VTVTPPSIMSWRSSSTADHDPQIMIVEADRVGLASARARMTARVAVVMTMGALHAGHTALMREARAAADHVIVTIFVNPLQFGPHEDFDRYPRSLAEDLQICRNEGIDLVFTPSREAVFPDGEPNVRVEPGTLATLLEGATRPGHFHGVLTVVLKLLHLTRADVAYFGEKDYQQLALIRAMVRDLDVPVDIVAVPTVRESDGLALSSRNRYLSPAEREAARALPRALRAAKAAAGDGLGGRAALAAAREEIASTPGVEPDYLELTDPELGPAPALGQARLLVAAWVGTTRLIDNIAINLADQGHVRNEDRFQPAIGGG
jgi:pantoate--beta-alanine ligase